MSIFAGGFRHQIAPNLISLRDFRVLSFDPEGVVFSRSGKGGIKRTVPEKYKAPSYTCFPTPGTDGTVLRKLPISEPLFSGLESLLGIQPAVQNLAVQIFAP